MATIADKFTPKPLEVYSDFLASFDTHPLSNDLAKIKNEQAIKQSIRNLVLTNEGERFFRPNLGSAVYKSLFEPLDGFSITNIQTHIENTIQKYEPRAKLISVIVRDVEGTGETAVATIQFSIINTGQVTDLNLILRRVR